MKRAITLGSVLAVLCACQRDATPVSGPPEPGGAHASVQVADGYIVVLRPAGTTVADEARRIAARHGGVVRHLYTHALRGFAVTLPAGAAEAVRGDAAVALVEPDAEVRAAAQLLPAGIDRVDADLNPTAAIDGVDDALDVDIAILDSGIDPTHPDLRVVQFKNCIDDNDNDGQGHGTHVAGIAAARDNADGVVGVAPGARLWAVKVLGDGGGGTISSVICGLDHVTANAASVEVANLSLGGALYSDALRAAVESAARAGVFIAAAAGNSGSDVYGADGLANTRDDFVPAAYPEAAAVSAMYDQDGRAGGAGRSSAECTGGLPDDALACFSNLSRSAGGKPVRSPGLAIDLAAPGTEVRSTYRGGGYATMSGTSMASPHVAGAAALYILRKGRRDMDGDGAVGLADVNVVRQALIDLGEPQSAWRADGATLDPDGNREPLLDVASLDAPPPTLPPAPVVTPDAGTAEASAGSGGLALTFEVLNRGAAEQVFQLSCGVRGAVASCAAPSSVTVAAGGTARVAVTYATAATAGSGSLVLAAQGSGGSDTGLYAVTVSAPPPAAAVPVVTPDAGSASALDRTTGNSLPFTVANPGGVEETLALICRVEGQVGACTAPASVTVAPGGSATVTVGYATLAAGSGRVTLEATGAAGSDQGSYTVTVTNGSAILRVSAVAVSATQKGTSTTATATVTVVDGHGAAVAEAVVTGDFLVNGAVAARGVTGRTDGSGIARIRATLKAKRGDRVRFCVTDVASPGRSYGDTATACGESTAQ